MEESAASPTTLIELSPVQYRATSRKTLVTCVHSSTVVFAFERELDALFLDWRGPRPAHASEGATDTGVQAQRVEGRGRLGGSRGGGQHPRRSGAPWCAPAWPGLPEERQLVAGTPT
jgi:hypothetical protein